MTNFVIAFGLDEFGDPLTALVFGAVWFKAGQGKGICSATPVTIGEIVKVNEKTVRRRLADLVKGGYLNDLTPEEKQRSKVHDYQVTPKGLTLTECRKADETPDADKITDTQSLHAGNEPANSGQTVPSDEQDTGHKVPSRSHKDQPANDNGLSDRNKGQRVQQKEVNKTPANNLDKPLEGEAEKVEPSPNGADAPPPQAIPVATFPAGVFPDPADYTVKQIEAWVLRKSQWLEVLAREKAGKDRAGVKRHITQRLEKKPKAVEVYREEACTYPEKTTYDLMSETVGDDPDDLDFWRQVVKNYIAHGWNKLNIIGMLDYYKRREIPNKTQGANNGNSTDDSGGNSGGKRQAKKPAGIRSPGWKYEADRSYLDEYIASPAIGD